MNRKLVWRNASRDRAELGIGILLKFNSIYLTSINVTKVTIEQVTYSTYHIQSLSN
jgi:hypothetical protein